MDAQTGLRPTVPGRPPVSRRVSLAAVAATVAVVAMLVGAGALVELPPTVDRITLVNPTQFALDVAVNSGGSGPWSPVGIVEQRSTQVAEQVLDQGDEWVFRFAGQGRAAGETRLSRSQLEQSNWKLEIPVTIGEALTAAGAAPNP